jgi:hypothetical protein
MTDKKDPLDITDLPDKAEGADAVKGGVSTKPVKDKPVGNTLHQGCGPQMETSLTNTFCCE